MSSIKTITSVILPLVTAVFLVLLCVFAVTEAAPVTEQWIEDNALELEELKAELGELAAADEEAAEEIKEDIAELEHSNEVLMKKQTVYITAMVIILTFLVGLSLYMQFSGVSLGAFSCAVCMLLGIGATYQFLFLFEMQYVIMLILAVIAGTVMYAVCRRLHTVSDKLYYILVGAVFVLLLVNILFGKDFGSGARLWLVIGGVSVQIGEFVKIFVVLIGAMAYRNKKRCGIYIVTTLLSCGVLLWLNDLGNAAALFCTFIFMSYMLFDSKPISIGIIIGALIALIVAVSLSDRAMSRLVNFGHAMTRTDSFQQKRVIEAIALGGFGGMGIDYSWYITGTYSAASDTAIAGVMAIFGVPLMVFTILSYVQIVTQPAHNRAVYPSSHLILVQISVLIAVQVVLNFCGSIDLLPFTGIVAPLISDGGSAMIAFMAMLGLEAAAMYPAVRKKKENNI